MRCGQRRLWGFGIIATSSALAQVRCQGRDPELGTNTPIADAAVDGNPDNVPSPPPFGGVEQIVAGEAFTCARGSGGAVRCWGSNAHGQLGQDSPAPHRADVSATSSIRFNTDEKVLEIAAAYETACALFERGSIRCWGGNGAGERGSGDLAAKGRAPGDMASLVPVDIGPGRAAAHVYAGTRHFCVITHNVGEVLCWGLGQDNGGRFGWLGNSRPDNIGDQAGEMGSALTVVPLPEPTVELALGFTATCARGESGAVRCFGVSRAGQLGTGSTANDPVLDIDDNVKAAAPTVDAGAFALFGNGPSFAVKMADGTTLSWGQNDDGRLGMGNKDDVGTPTYLLAPKDILSVTSRSAHRCVILLGGDVYCFGGGQFGRLGYGDAASRGDTSATSLAGLTTPTPTPPVLTKVRSMALGGDHTCALRDDDTVVCWGRNNSGQLGYGDTSDRGAQVADRAAVLPPIRLD